MSGLLSRWNCCESHACRPPSNILAVHGEYCSEIIDFYSSAEEIPLDDTKFFGEIVGITTV